MSGTSSSFDLVPYGRDQVLDPDWLGSALGVRHRGCQVAAVAVRHTRRTIASKLFLVVDYEDPGTPPAPTGLCVKGYFDEARTSSGAGYSEARFYRDLASSTRVRMPGCSYVGLDEATTSSVLVMEDVEAAGGRLLDALEPFGVELCAATLDQLARLHAASWEDAVLEEPWLAPRMGSLAASVPLEHLQSLLDRPRAEGLSAAVRDATRVRTAMEAVGRRTTTAVPCLIHGDTHSGNIYDATTGPGLLDWQLVQRGSWANDVAYHIGSVLEVEERRDSEWDLLAGYLGALRRQGAPAPPWEEAVTAYRAHLPYGLFLWSMTQYTAEPITTATLQRLGHAVEDHESFELLGA
jgi:hypothetical protein